MISNLAQAIQHYVIKYPNYQIYFIVVYMPQYFLWVYSILMQVKTLFITLVSCMLLKIEKGKNDKQWSKKKTTQKTED
jgi:hypothetical protein